jgi:hypothetical protein
MERWLVYHFPATRSNGRTPVSDFDRWVICHARHTTRYLAVWAIKMKFFLLAGGIIGWHATPAIHPAGI